MEKFTVTLGQYKGLARPVLNDEVTDAELESFLRREQLQHSTAVTVDEPARNRDTVVMDFAGFCDGEQFEGGTAKNHSLVLGSGTFIPGFEEQLIGHSAGEEVSVLVTFPEEYHAENLAGKKAVFRCTIHQVQRQQLPRLDDAFAANYGLKSIAQLRQVAREALKEQKQQQNRRAEQNALLDLLSSKSQITVSPEYVEERLHQLRNTFTQNLASQGITLQEYLQYTKMSYDDLNDQLRPQAEAAAKATAVLYAVAQEEKIEVSDRELDAEIAKMAESYDMSLEELKEAMTPENREAIRVGMATGKAMNFIFRESVPG